MPSSGLPPVQRGVDEGGGFWTDVGGGGDFVGGGAAQAIDRAEMGQSHSPHETD